MPKIKSVQRKKTVDERIKELQDQAKNKKDEGRKLTVAELEERINLLEQRVFGV